MTLVEQTQKQILKYMSDHAGEKQMIKEHEFSEAFGVSRIVVREALSRLRVLGLIETRRNSGSRLVNPDVFGVVKTVIEAGALSKEMIRDLYEFRVVLEVGATDLIFRGKKPEQVERLKSIVEQEMENAWKLKHSNGSEEDIKCAQSILDGDLAFHKILMEMTGNKSLISFQSALSELFKLYTVEVGKDYLTDVMVHKNLLMLLETGTPDEFRMAINYHMRGLLAEEDELLENFK